MTEWYYAIDGKRGGPVSQSDIEGMAREGKLSKTALVWSEDFEGWQRITDVNMFAPLLVIKKSPPPLPPEAFPDLPDANLDPGDIVARTDNTTKFEETKEYWQIPEGEEGAGEYIRPSRKARAFHPNENVPWRRYFARLIDISLATPIALAGAIIAALALKSYFGVAIVGSMVFVMIGFFLVAMAFLIAVITWAFGNSPGKAVYAIRVVPELSERSPSFFYVFFRELKVYIFGLALGIGPIAIIPQLFAYKALTSGRRVFYDRDSEVEDTRVFSYDDGQGRMTLAIISTAVSIVILLVTMAITGEMLNDIAWLLR